MPNPPTKPTFKIVKTYDYRAADGRLAYQVVRLEPKDFRVRTISETGELEDEEFGFSFDWGLHCGRLLYNLINVSKCEDDIYICAGEKDAETAISLGFCATTNSGGEAVKWVGESGLEDWVKPLTGKSVVIVPDNDETGKAHALHLLEILSPICRSVKVLYVPSDFKDLTLWVESGIKRDDILSARQSLDYDLKDKTETLPNAEHSEALVLGAVLSGRIAFTEISHLAPDDFYTYSRIFAACSEVYGETSSCESHLVAQKLDDRGILLECGGASKLVELCEDIPAGDFSAETHLGAILERSEARRLISRLDAAKSRLMLNGGTPGEVVDELVEYSKTSASGIVRIKTLEDSIPDIDKFMEPSPIGFVCGPVKPFMQVFNGLGASDFSREDGKSGKLIVIAGLPGGGKSSLVGQIVGWMVTQHNLETEIISLEIPWQDCLKKICCQLARVPYMTFVTGQATPEQVARVRRMLEVVRQKPLRIDSNSGWTIGKIRSHVKQRSRTKSPLKLLVIDYLQLLPFSSKHRADLALNEITRGLKAIANDFGLDVILLCQMTKENGRENREPENRDLKDVGAGDPDVIAFVHTIEDEESGHLRRIAILVKKNRNGPLIKRECLFFKPYTLFVDEHYREYIAKVSAYLHEIKTDDEY